MKTKICDLLEIKYPIIQGGMAWISTYELVSAVSEAGALGVIGCGNQRGEWLRQQIWETRKRTQNPFGVNIMLLSPYVEECLRVVVEEKVKVVTFGGGNPSAYIPELRERGIKVLPVVSSVAMARRVEEAGASAVIAEGMEAGGHIGEVTTFALIPQVVDAVKIPVVAAGGIADGRGFIAALALGAQGVQMGTRFICSTECIAHPNFKKKIIEAGDRSTVVTGAISGLRIRCLENKFTREFLRMEKEGASREQLEAFGIGRLYKGIIEGDVEEGSLMAGQIAGLIKDIKPVKQIIEDIMAEAEHVTANVAGVWISYP